MLSLLELWCTPSMVLFFRESPDDVFPLLDLLSELPLLFEDEIEVESDAIMFG